MKTYRGYFKNSNRETAAEVYALLPSMLDKAKYENKNEASEKGTKQTNLGSIPA
jgi:hypothetical protein